MFKAYYTDCVTVVEPTGASSWGEKTEKETTVRARVEYKNVMVRNFKGEMVVSAALVYMQDRTLTPAARIKIDGVEHPILNILKRRAFSKNAQLEVQVG